MGGKITRAYFKSQRSKPLSRSLNDNQNSQLRDLAQSFSLILILISSFLIGFLYRPYSLIRLNQYFDQYSNSGEGWDLLIVLGLVGVFVTTQLGGNGVLADVKIVNGVMIKAAVVVLAMDFLTITLLNVDQQYFGVKIYYIIKIAYFLLIICMTHNSLLYFNQTKIISNKREIKKSKKEQPCQQLNTLYRSLFIIGMLFIFSSGLNLSTYVNNLRMQIHAQQLLKSTNQQISTPSQIFKLLTSEQKTHIFSSLHYQRPTLRIIFNVLIFMMTITLIALESKAFFVFFWFQKQKQFNIKKIQPHLTEVKTNPTSKLKIAFLTILFFITTCFFQQIQQNLIINNQSQFKSQYQFKNNTILFIYVSLLSAILIYIKIWLNKSKINKLSSIVDITVIIFYLGLSYYFKFFYELSKFWQFYFCLSFISIYSILILSEYLSQYSQSKQIQNLFQPYLILSVSLIMITKFYLSYNTLSIITYPIICIAQFIQAQSSIIVSLIVLVVLIVMNMLKDKESLKKQSFVINFNQHMNQEQFILLNNKDQSK